jgi:hypothetical protein
VAAQVVASRAVLSCTELVSYFLHKFGLFVSVVGRLRDTTNHYSEEKSKLHVKLTDIKIASPILKLLFVVFVRRS